MAGRRFRKGQVYKKGKNWIGQWREDIIHSDGTLLTKRKGNAILKKQNHVNTKQRKAPGLCSSV